MYQTSSIKVNGILLTISGTNSGYAPTSLGRGNTKIIEDNNEVVVDGYYSSVAIIQIVNMD